MRSAAVFYAPSAWENGGSVSIDFCGHVCPERFYEDISGRYGGKQSCAGNPWLCRKNGTGQYGGRADGEAFKSVYAKRLFAVFPECDGTGMGVPLRHLSAVRYRGGLWGMAAVPQLKGQEGGLPLSVSACFRFAVHGRDGGFLLCLALNSGWRKNAD